jgi:hypothetical protein
MEVKSCKNEMFNTKGSHYDDEDILVLLLKKIDEKFDTLRGEISENFKLLNMRIDSLEELVRDPNRVSKH